MTFNILPMENNPWHTRELRTPTRPSVEWLRLGAIGVPECTVGVLKNGTWVVDTADGLADLHETPALTFILPLLNSPTETAREMLANFRRSANLLQINLDEFPLNRLIVRAISSGGYWAEQAFRWLPEIDLNVDERAAVIHGLMSIENNKVFNQSLRHEASRHRRQIESGK